jgi:spermidine/putrescine transport system permease protein
VNTTAPQAASPASRVLLALHALAVYLFLYAPIAILMVFSFNAEKQTAVWKGFTTQWYAALLHNRLIRDPVMNSLIVAAASAAASTVIGTMAALGLARFDVLPRRRGRGKAATRALLLLPLVIPEIVVGAALLTFFSVTRWELGLTTIIIAHVTFGTSYVAVVVAARLAGFDRTLEEAAADLGANAAATFLRVKLPLIFPGIAAGALLAFTVSIDDYVITSFVGTGSPTLPLYIYSMLRTGVTPEVNAVSTVLLVFTIILILAAQRLLRKGEP